MAKTDYEQATRSGVICGLEMANDMLGMYFFEDVPTDIEDACNDFLEIVRSDLEQLRLEQKALYEKNIL